MYHELFVLLSFANENNGMLQYHTLPQTITQMLESSKEQQLLKKTLKKLTDYQLLEKTANQHYTITSRGRIALSNYKIYLEQQHQKGPHYYIETGETVTYKHWQFRMLSLLVTLAATFTFYKQESFLLYGFLDIYLPLR